MNGDLHKIKLYIETKDLMVSFKYVSFVKLRGPPHYLCKRPRQCLPRERSRRGSEYFFSQWTIPLQEGLKIQTFKESMVVSMECCKNKRFTYSWLSTSNCSSYCRDYLNWQVQSWNAKFRVLVEKWARRRNIASVSVSSTEYIQLIFCFSWIQRHRCVWRFTDTECALRRPMTCDNHPISIPCS